MESLYIYGLAAMLGAIFKFSILAQSLTQSRTAAAFNLIATSLILQNICECAAFLLFSSRPDLADIAATGVIMSMSITCPAVIQFCLHVTELRHHRSLSALAWALSLPVTLLTVSGSVVLGAQLSDVLLVTVPGKYYSLFQLQILATIALCCILLLCSLFSEAHEVRLRTKASLVAILPIFILGTYITILRLYGVNQSSGILMPLASTWFVWVLLKSQTNIVELRLHWIVFWFHIRQAFSSPMQGNVSDLKESMDWFEQKQLTAAMKSSNYVVSEAARRVGIPRETFSRKWKRVCEENRTMSYRSAKKASTTN